MNIIEEVDDNGRFLEKYKQKRRNAEKVGIKFLLTEKQFARLIKKAGILTSDLGYTGNCYDLARKGDRGAYEIGNCRFITHRENMAEQTRGPKTLKKLRNTRDRNGSLTDFVTFRCGSCKKEFQSKRTPQFCSVECRQKEIKPPRRTGITVQEERRIQTLRRKKGLSSYKISEITGFARNTVMNHW